MSYSVESTLAGKLGSIGQPVLRAKAKDMEKQFANRLRAAFAPAAPEERDDPVRTRRTDLARRAIKLLDPDDATVRPIAGGTALMLMMKAGVFRPAKLVSLRKIEQKYSGIAAGSDGLRIGAMTTLIGARALGRGAQARAGDHPHHAARCRTCGCATSRPSAARWRTAIRTWTCRRC